MRNAHAPPWRALLIVSSIVLTLSIVASVAVLALNVSYGWELSFGAAVLMGLATAGGPAVSAFGRMAGHDRITRATVAVCIAMSMWTEVHFHAQASADANGTAEAQTSSRSMAQEDLAAARARIGEIKEVATVADLDALEKAENETIARLAKAHEDELKKLKGTKVTCPERTTCSEALRALQAAEEVRKAIQARKPLAREKAALQASLAPTKREAKAEVKQTDALVSMISAFTGWSKTILQRAETVIFVGFLVAINSLLPLLGGRALEGISRALAIRRGDAEAAQSGLECSAYTWQASRMPTPEELVRLSEAGMSYREIEAHYSGQGIRISKSQVGNLISNYRRKLLT